MQSPSGSLCPIIKKKLCDFKNDLTYLQIIEDNFYLKDKQVTFIYNNEERTGKVVGIDKFGGILIEENNTIKSYQTGEMLLKKK